MSTHDDREFPGFTNVYADIGEADLVGWVESSEPTISERVGSEDSTHPTNPLTRRQFLGATTIAALAAASGCRRPDLKILPYSQPPEHSTPGLPTFYATSMPKPGGCFPILVETHEGRPTKIEGHPTHPASMGGSDVFAQASIYDLYSPDRSKEVLKRNAEGKLVPSTWEAFDDFARMHFAELKKKEGEGLAFLLEDNPSPALRLLREEHLKKLFPKAVWSVYEPIDKENEREGTRIVAGGEWNSVPETTPRRIVSLDCDFLGTEGNAIANSRAFAESRRGKKSEHIESNPDISRLYVVESTYTITGAMADHRLSLPAAHIVDYAIALAREISSQSKVGPRDTIKNALKMGPDITVSDPWIKVVAADLVEHGSGSFVVAGNRQPPLVHALCCLINDALLTEGIPGFFSEANPDDRAIPQLTKAISAGEIKTLVVVGGNPVFNAPADLQFAAALESIPTVVRLGSFVDETSAKAAWHLPQAHFLESWGDAQTAREEHCCIQPAIAPLHGGRSVLELFILISGWEKAATNSDAKSKVNQLLQASFNKQAKKTEDLDFKRFVQQGYHKTDEPLLDSFIRDGGKIAKAMAEHNSPKPISLTNIEITFHPSYALFDGRFAHNTWLMELPDPITKLVWDNAALISPATAEQLQVKTGDILEIDNGSAKVRIPAFVLPGQADNSIALHLGWGNQRIAHGGQGGGFNGYPLRTSTAMHFTTAKVTKTNETYDLVTTQEHATIPADKRHEIIREHNIHDHANLEHQHDDPKARFQWGYEQSKYKGTDDTRRIALQQAQDVAVPQALDGDMQWGMVIDLNTCTGCSACVIACQAENNIPVVGKNEVKMNREMHWISVHRYFTSTKGEIRGGLEQLPADDPGIVTQPMMCQHCEAAPCESVCPVNAAVHSPEGLNLQVYNRCIGTRYCSNNCPYKARRFNWFDFNKRRLDELRVPTPFSEAGMPETLKMQKNPEVTVRMRGVMEKCTYCIQRIERARIGAKVLAIKAGADKPDAVAPANPYEAGYDIQIIDGVPRIVVPDGIIKTACEQACPSKAITFGNVRDKNSRVYKLKNTGDDYLVLGSINTKPRTSYLPRLRNPNPKMKND